MNTDRYTSPLSERYASKEMQYIFSQDKKFTTWRKLWIALAETEMELGLSENGKPVISQEQIDEMKAHVDEINYDVAKAREPFFTTKSASERSGMGFSFMEAFMDTLEVESEPGKGTTVRMTKRIGRDDSV